MGLGLKDDLDKINLADELTEVSVGTEGLIDGQTPLRDEKLSGGRETSRFKDTVQGEAIDWEAWKKAPADRKNFYFVRPESVPVVIKKQYQNYFKNPGGYGLTEESTIKDVIKKFDQENPKHKITRMQDKGIDVDIKIKDAKKKFDLSKVNPFAATNAEASEVGKLGLTDDLEGIDKLGLKDDLDPVADPREDLSLGQKILTTKPVNALGDFLEYAGKAGKDMFEYQVKRPAMDFNSAIQLGMSSTLQPLATAYDYYADKITNATGIGDTEKKRGLQIITDEYKQLAKESSDEGIDPNNAVLKFNKALFQGLGAAASFIPKVMVAAQIPLLGGVSLGIVSGMEATPEGAEEAAAAAIEGTFLQQYLKGVSLLPKSIQLPTAFSIFAGSAAMKGADPEDIIASGVIGVGLSLASKAPTMKEFRSRYAKKDFMPLYRDQVAAIKKSQRFSNLRTWAKQTKFLLGKYGEKSALIKEIETIMKNDGNAVSNQKASHIAEGILDLWSRQVGLARTRGVGIRLKTPKELLLEGKKVAIGKDKPLDKAGLKKYQKQVTEEFVLDMYGEVKECRVLERDGAARMRQWLEEQSGKKLKGVTDLEILAKAKEMYEIRQTNKDMSAVEFGFDTEDIKGSTEKAEEETEVSVELKKKFPEITDEEIAGVEKIIKVEDPWEEDKIDRAIEVYQQIKATEEKPIETVKKEEVTAESLKKESREAKTAEERKAVLDKTKEYFKDKEEEKKPEIKYTVTSADIIPTKDGYKAVETERREETEYEYKKIKIIPTREGIKIEEVSTEDLDKFIEDGETKKAYLNTPKGAFKAEIIEDNEDRQLYKIKWLEGELKGETFSMSYNDFNKNSVESISEMVQEEKKDTTKYVQEDIDQVSGMYASHGAQALDTYIEGEYRPELKKIAQYRKDKGKFPEANWEKIDSIKSPDLRAKEKKEEVIQDKHEKQTLKDIEETLAGESKLGWSVPTLHDYLQGSHYAITDTKSLAKQTKQLKEVRDSLKEVLKPKEEVSEIADLEAQLEEVDPGSIEEEEIKSEIDFLKRQGEMKKKEIEGRIFEIGDRVKYSGDTEKYKGKEGKVSGYDYSGRVEVVFDGTRSKWQVNQSTLNKVEKPEESGILKVEEKEDVKDKETEDVLERAGAGESVQSELERERRREHTGSVAQTAEVEREERLGNYRITEADEIGKGGPKTKFKNNVAAIKLLKQLESENRKATPEEQQVLVKYVGWGGLSKVFEYSWQSDWKNEQKELQELLTDEEYKTARASTINAHYTAPQVISSMWEGLQHLGFRTGKVLEPASGVGHFLGLAPNYKGISFTGVELDSLTGRIAQQLYQHANIQVKGFQDAELPNNFFDVAISNVPFADVRPFDKRWQMLGIPKRLVLHDYFFAKSLALLKPGGVMAFITSKGTMDKNNTKFREYINGKAQFLGAVRLPSNAFKENAGTEVVTDIMFLQKLKEGEKAKKVDWIDVSPFEVGEKAVNINNYFRDNPDSVLGTLGIGRGLYSDSELTVDALSTGVDGLTELLKGILKENTYKTTENEQGIDVTETEDIEDSSNKKDGSYIIKDKKIYIKEGDKAVEHKIDKNAEARLKGLIGLKDLVRDLLADQLHGKSDAEIKKQQQRLSKEYDAFIKKYGYINDRVNEQAFWDDPDSPLLSSIEVPIKKVGKKQNYKKHDIFTKRVLVHHEKPTTAKNPKDSLNISLAEYGKINWAYMSELLNTPVDDIVSSLLKDEIIYKNPEGEYYETKDEYLSGNVKLKLKLAETAARVDEGYKANVEALKGVIPKDLEFNEIAVKLGMPWIETGTYSDFLKHLGIRGANVRLSNVDGSWSIEKTTRGYYDRFSPQSTANISEHGTVRFPATKVFEAVANGVPVKVIDTFTNPDGTKTRTLNEEETAKAEDKAELMKENFKDWFWSEEDRRDKYLKIYNDDWNNTVDRKYDGAHLVFPSMNPNAFEEGFRKTQQDGIARGISSHRLMLAHAVGSGKTAVGIAILMESKRLGLINKGMVVAQKNIIPGWRSQINQLYPSAKVLVADEKNFDRTRRAKFLAKIATGDWDIVVIPESSYEFIQVSDEAYKAYVDEEMQILRDHIADLKASGSKISVKQIEKKILSMEEKLKARLAKSGKDDFLRFEELGIDALIVDEADRYKNVAYVTKKQGIRGMGSAEGSNKSADMMMKTKIIREKNGKLIFATGTPISNSMVEVYSMLKYLQPELLEQQGIKTFDAWANTFGEVESALEVDVSGGRYKMVNRFSNFVNIQELFSMLKQTWDIQTAKMLEDQGILVKGKNLPLVNSDIEADILPISPELSAYKETLIERTKKIKERKGPPKKGDDIMLSVLSDGMKASLDMRMIDPLSRVDPNSKIEVAISGIHEAWKRTKASKGTQIVFIDRVKPNKDAAFNPHYYMRKQLVKLGIPEKEIAFIHDFDTEQKKTRLYDDVNDGTVRIIFGSTEKLGAGTNIQERLHTLWHLDIPWRPRDMEQREGRIVRPGNSNKEVTVHKLVTKGSLDTFMYSALEKKANTIEQILSGRSKERILAEEGIDEFEAIKSLSSANPLVKEKGELDRDVRKLRILKQSFQKEAFEAEKNIKSIPGQIESLNADIKKDESFISKRPAKPTKETFSLTIKGKEYKDKETALAAIEEELRLLSPEDYKVNSVVGKYLGLDLYVGKYYEVGKDKMINYVGVDDYAGTVSQDPTGTFASLDNQIFTGPEKRIQDNKASIVELGNKLKYSRDIISKGFPKESELTKKLQRQVEVNRELKKEVEETEVDDEGLGPAEAIPLGLSIKVPSKSEPVPELEAAFDRILDLWIGEKDFRTTLEIPAEKKAFQTRIREALGEKKYTQKVKDYDTAIQIYIDLKRNPAHLSEYYDQLSKDQQRIVDISQNLPSKLQVIADDMSASYKAIGLESQSAGIIRNVLDNYVGRVWKDTELFRKFGVASRHGRQRKLDTILQGWANGLELQIKGSTSNLAILKEEMVKTIEDKRFVSDLQKIRDLEGNPLLTTKHLEGYIKVKHPNFKTWKWVGKAKEAEVYGKNVFIDDDGNLFERQELYAPKAQAKDLNNILGVSALKNIGGKGGWIIDKATKYNAVIKAWVLQTSLFHHLAFGRSYYLGTNRKYFKEMNIVDAVKEGNAMIDLLDPIIELAVRNGLTLGRKQDWNEDLLRETTLIGRTIDKVNKSLGIFGKPAAETKDKLLKLRQSQADFLFGVVGTGLKAKAFAIEFRNQKKKYPKTDDNVIAKRVASLINDDFGGLHLQRMRRNPTIQHIFRLLALAPDWTESNIRSMVKVFGGGRGATKAETEMYRHFWSGILMKGLLATVLMNVLMAMLDEDDEEGVGVLGRFIRNYTIAFQAGKFRWLDVDITPIRKAFGYEGADRFYFSILGHFKDPLKFVIRNERAKNGEKTGTFHLGNPEAFKYKAAIMSKIAMDYVTGVDYKNAAFTNFDELVGTDDKGVYKRKTTKKGTTYLPGDPKGGQLKGQTVAWKWGEPAGIVQIEQMPSFVLNQAKGSQPIQFQQAFGYFAGELDGFIAIANSLGLGVSKTYGRQSTEDRLEDFKDMNFREALTTYQNASKEMRKKFLPYLGKKIQRSTSKTKEDVALYKKLLKER